MIRSHSKIIKPSLAQPSLLASTQLIQAATPVSTHETRPLKVMQPKFQVRQTHFSNEPVSFARSAFHIKTETPKANPILPRANPIQSQSDTSSDSPAARISRQYTSPKTEEAYLAALPREFPSATRQELEGVPIDLGNLRGLFTGQVRQRIANAKYYPRIAQRRGMEGQPVIAFTLDKGGRIMKAALAQTSGYQLLDQAALEAVHQAAPYPAIPDELKTDTFQFKLPISFILK